MAALQSIALDVTSLINHNFYPSMAANLRFLDNGVEVKWNLTSINNPASEPANWNGYDTPLAAGLPEVLAHLSVPQLYNGYAVTKAMVNNLLYLFFVPVGTITGVDVYNSSNQLAGLSGLLVAGSQAVVDPNYAGVSVAVIAKAVQAGYDAHGMMAV
jgi:hypothetical protein